MEEKTGYMTIDEKTAEEIENKMPEESELYELADLFKACLLYTSPSPRDS